MEPLFNRITHVGDKGCLIKSYASFLLQTINHALFVLALFACHPSSSLINKESLMDYDSGNGLMARIRDVTNYNAETIKRKWTYVQN